MSAPPNASSKLASNAASKFASNALGSGWLFELGGSAGGGAFGGDFIGSSSWMKIKSQLELPLLLAIMIVWVVCF